jgi:HEAT repeat protein
MKQFLRADLAGLLFAIGSNCLAVPSSHTDSLCNQADAIVVAGTQMGRQTGRHVAFDLAVMRVVKGSLAAGTSISVQWDGAWPPANTDLPAYFGLWFLRNGNADHWTLIPVKDGRIPAEQTYFPLSLGIAPANTTGAFPATSITDQVSLELDAAIEHYVDVGQLARASNGLVGASDSPLTLDIYHRLSRATDPELRTLGLAALVIKSSDPTALTGLVNSIDQAAGLTMGPYALSAIRNLRDASQNTLDALTKVVVSSNPVVQRSAAEALGNLHTRESLSVLASLLDSSDRETRRAAMKGFSMFVENLPITMSQDIPSQKWRVPKGPAPYRTPDTDRYSLTTTVALDPAQESDYLQFWKSWWTRMKAQILP